MRRPLPILSRDRALANALYGRQEAARVGASATTHHAMFMMKTKALREDIIVTFLHSLSEEDVNEKTSASGYLFVEEFNDAGYEALALSDDEYYTYLFNFVFVD